jgi:hypothetical protein
MTKRHPTGARERHRGDARSSAHRHDARGRIDTGPEIDTVNASAPLGRLFLENLAGHVRLDEGRALLAAMRVHHLATESA